jgi:hypothetical protein
VQEKSVLSQLFPQPTGKNAYEDFVRAAELLKSSPLWAEAQQKNTLTSRRRALSDPPVRQARALIDAAMLKPSLPPQRELNFFTVFPEFAGFRDCARLLNAEMHVLFSEGRTAAALVSFAQGLHLGRSSKSQVLIGGLVGIAIDSILLTRVKSHLEQCTPRDCDRLQATLREHVERDKDSALDSISSELKSFEAAMELGRKDFTGFMDSIFTQPIHDSDTGEPPPMEEMEAYRRARAQIDALKNNPAGQARVFDKLIATNKARVQAELRYLSDPHTSLKIPEDPTGELELGIHNTVSPMYRTTSNRFIQDRIQCQLLYCHTAIRKYKWEWEKLPDSLEALKLAEWSLDPYTRQPFRYEKKGESYELFSVGPVGEEGKRASVHLPWRKD